MLVMCTDDPDQDEELEPLFMANLPALRDENRRIGEWGKASPYPTPDQTEKARFH